MTVNKAILGIVPTMQAAAIASSAYKAIPKKKCRKPMKKIIGGAADIMIGTSLMKASADFIGGID